VGVALKDLRGKVKRPIRSVTVCLDGELWSRHDELTERLDHLRAQNPGRMAQSCESVEVAQELTEVESAMKASSVTIEFRGISGYQFKAIQARFPAEDKNLAWDVDAGGHALVAACAVEPTTEDEARELLEEVHQAVANKLLNAAYVATTGSSDVPFSARAYELTNGSGSK
jgi:hypothetical protein